MSHLALAVAALLATAIDVQPPVKVPVEGITNFAQVETTVACGGSMDAAVAVPHLQTLGFVSVINLRERGEPGVDIDRERAIVEAAGLKYIHIPFNGAKPEAAAADAFLAAIAMPGLQPAFIHCGTGNRAAAMWLIKRLVVDGWDTARAVAEAGGLGLTNAALRRFALDYVASRK